MPTSRATTQINNDVERAMTFHNLHKKLFKEAAELSILTGARIAVVLELEYGKVYSFGTPSAKAVVDNFFSGNIYTELGGEQNASIMQLQSKVVELGRDLVEVKEMEKAPKKVGNEFPQVQVAPQMPPSHTSLVHLGSSTGGERVGVEGGYGHDVVSSGY